MNMIPLSALDRPIAYHRIFRKVSGSTVAAVFLSQAWYWSQRLPEGRDGWFYKKQTEWEDETGLSRSEQETARKKLVQLGILEERREGLPAVLWYRINTDQLSRLIRDELGNAGTPQSSFSDTRNPDAVIPATIHTETTTETTPPPVDMAEHEERFERFWTAYPKKENRKWCHAWWMKKKPDEQMTSHMIAAVKAQAKEKRWTPERKQYIPLPSTWLNNDRWTDEVSGMPSIHVNTKPASEMTEAERIQAEIDEENREKRMFGAERVQWFIAKHARLDELKKEQG